jgi:prepilin-type N-terminal cleavage/methylation domain-containing protein
MNHRKGAFTLIELLVVIAIIAILAAILFPVFSQAKLAAKGAQTLSNMKQNALAELMYQNDYDDVFCLTTAWNDGNDPVTLGPGLNVSTWVWLIQPYEKNADIDLDPMAPPITVPSTGGWTKAAWYSIFNTIGYNYGSLCPFLNVGLPTSYQQPANSSTVSNISGMPMFGGKDAATEMTSGYVYVYAYQFTPYGDNGPMLNQTIERPYCFEANACLASWGYGIGATGYQNQVDNLLSDNIVAGARTGRVSLRRASVGTLSFADGHAKAETPGSLAVGTNFSMTQSTNLTKITNPNTYRWTLTPGGY